MTAADDADYVSERALLGSAISSTEQAIAIVEQVKLGDLRDPANAAILTVLADLIGRGLHVSPAIVLSELGKAGRLVGRLDGLYLHALVAEAALPSQIAQHVSDIKARAWKDRMRTFGTRCVQASENLGRAPEDDAELLYGWLDELSDVDTSDGTAQAADLIHSVLDEIEQGSDADVVPTGFSDLDALMSMRPGQLIVVGARPGGGKSTFGMDVARQVGIKLHSPVYFLTLEMSRSELMKRMISAEAKVALHTILHHTLDRPTLTDGDWDRIAEATKRIEQSTITIDDASGVGLARIRARLRHMKRTTGVRLAVIDYLGILSTPGRAETRQQVIADLTGGLKQMAREIGIPIILLAQLNRQVMGRPDRRPMASDLKDSGAIEADADVVILLHREDMYEKESPRAGEADFIVDKHRAGPQSTITVAFQGHYSRFVDMAGEPDPTTPASRGHLKAVQ